MSVKTAFKGRLDLKFFEREEFEFLANADPEHHALITARNALRLLMMGWPVSWAELISWPVIKAIFIAPNPELMKAMRRAFQQGFHHLFSQLEHQYFNAEEQEQVQLYLSNCLSLLPYSDLTPYESIKIPQCVGNQWCLVDYYVTPIELTAVTGIKRFFIKDRDRVFAYGLEPVSNLQAQSHLIFMGTTYPAGQGFIPQVTTDFEGFDSVGYSLYQSGKKRIEQWLLKQNNKVHVCGISLGGALSLLLAIDQGQHLARVDALNPPGLYEAWNTPVDDGWECLSEKPKVVIQQQANDPVSLFGVWKKDWEIVHVTPPAKKQGPNLWCDHFLNYAGFEGTEFSYIPAEEQNLERAGRNFWIFSLGRSIFYYSTILPYSVLFHPFLASVYERLHQRGVQLLLLATFSLFTIPLLLGAPVLYALVGSFAFWMLAGTALVYSWHVNLEPTSGRAELHDPELPRNKEMDIYNSDNLIESTFTYDELHTYYKVMRCLVKNKEFIPDDDNPLKYNQDFSKREFLIACSDPERKEAVLQWKSTKAKAMHIRDTLALVKQFGMDNEVELKPVLEQEYSYYCLGKT